MIKRMVNIAVCLSLLMGSVVGLAALFVSPASASVNFSAGDIIDDSTFTNASSMSVQQIQDFLNAQVTCDTNGTQNISYYYNTSTGEVNNSNGGTWTTTSRATYGQRYATWYNAHPYGGYVNNMSVAPYVCVQNYVENPSTGQNNLQNPGASISGGESAAQIIYNAAQQYQINPQVLLTTLQKEQALVTDSWPWTYEYTEAMGFNCPDGGGCSGFAGFYQQVTAAASQYRNYLNNPQNFNYEVGNNTIEYDSPVYGCNQSSVVNVLNLATAALYDYTPYQPDANVLASTNAPGSSNGPGSSVSGDVCAAYGNRNFWWYFNTWFGPSVQPNLPGCNPATNTTLTCVWQMANPTNQDQYMTSSIQTRNDLYSEQSYQYLGVAFYGNVIIEPGNIPIYRLSQTNGGSFLTSSQSTYDSMQSSGWTGDGIDFYADPAGANAGYPVFQLYNSSTGQYFFTGSEGVVSTMTSEGWSNQGNVFNSIDTTRQETPAPQGLENVYRFYIPQTLEHFWTTDLNERDNMINDGYDYEGVALYSSASTTSTPIYRLYAPSIRQHLFTADLNEKNTLVAGGGWNYEGVSQYDTMTPDSSPVYRLYYPALGLHLLTSDINERNTLTGDGWNYEGIAWYQP